MKRTGTLSHPRSVARKTAPKLITPLTGALLSNRRNVSALQTAAKPSSPLRNNNKALILHNILPTYIGPRAANRSLRRVDRTLASLPQSHFRQMRPTRVRKSKTSMVHNLRRHEAPYRKDYQHELHYINVTNKEHLMLIPKARLVQELLDYVRAGLEMGDYLDDDNAYYHTKELWEHLDFPQDYGDHVKHRNNVRETQALWKLRGQISRLSKDQIISLLMIEAAHEIPNMMNDSIYKRFYPQYRRLDANRSTAYNIKYNSMKQKYVRRR